MGDIFELHSKVMQDYRDFVRASVHIADPRLRDFVDAELDGGRLWPDVMVQVSPGYRREKTVEDLAGEGILHPETAEFFRDARGSSFCLYTHQVRAIELAVEGRSFVLTSGTGSGKSLCFFLPIIDSLLRDPAPDGVTSALVVYPMNALVNSQLNSLQELGQRYRDRTGRDFPVRFARYTGETGEEERRQLRAEPPHILLTNYMMAELMLLRPQEAEFLKPARRALRFLVFDELHTHRGRGGADVGMLIRRLRERCGGPRLVHIGTSATMVSGPESTPGERREAVAAFAQKLFGCPFGPDQVVEESLTPVTEGGPPSADELKRAVREGGVPRSPDLFRRHPLARWMEHNLGIQEEEGGAFTRRAPRTLSEAAEEMARQTEEDAGLCEQRLREALAASAHAAAAAGAGVMPFKLHQFISQGQPLQATLEPRESRRFSMQGQVQDEQGRLLVPVRFCRICGQDYYCVRKRDGRFEPLPEQRYLAADEDEGSSAGYLMLETEATEGWSLDQLPDEWYDDRGRLRSPWKDRIPRPVYVCPDGAFSEDPSDGGLKMWFQPAPFSLCQRCGETYTAHQREFTKLGGVATEGWSTANSVLAVSLLRHSARTGAASSKLLTFTDNRQDASLQAGHFNDFVRSLLLRSALCAALRAVPELDSSTVAQEVVRNCGLQVRDVARNPALREGPNADQVWETFERLTLYRLYDDLRRGWSVVQPNLELVGLLRIGYTGLEELCADDSCWSFQPALADMAPAERERVVRAVLDEFRHQFALDARELQETNLKQLQKRCADDLGEPWGLDEREVLRSAGGFVLDGGGRRYEWFRKLSAQSSIGRYLTSELGLTRDEYDSFIRRFLDLLSRHGLLKPDGPVYRLDAACIRWRRGDGTPVPPGPPLRRRASSPQGDGAVSRVNEFYRRYYQEPPGELVGLEAREHTAQVVARGEREEREKRFRAKRNGADGSGVRPLPYLVCSPTLELGVDIADLELVQLRSVPPTPANYAQRSGRAGRQGQPGLIVTLCRAKSNHDQYYFQRCQDMVAGAVRPPRLDLANPALLRAHIHAVWLGGLGLSLGSSIRDIVDTRHPDLPLLPHIADGIRPGEKKKAEILKSIRAVLASGEVDLASAGIFDDEWLQKVVDTAPEDFDRAFDRWRELYRAALHLRQRGRALEDSAVNSDDVDKAKRMQDEARRQLDLLLQLKVAREESDFYPYRYLASEGFLPGYNFPSLEVRAWVNRGEGEFIRRPRVIAIREFAPGSVLYHEGARWRCESFMQPPGGLSQRVARRRFCHWCGGFTVEDDDVCPECGQLFGAERSRLEETLDLPNVRTRRIERITSGEEDRQARGYGIRTYFRRQGSAVEAAEVQAGESVLLRLEYASAASLLRVNYGWNEDGSHGFLVDLDTGEVCGRENGQDRGGMAPAVTPAAWRRVCLSVQSENNILRVQLVEPGLRSDESNEVSLQEALRRGLEQVFELEEGEIEAEALGEGDHRSILFYETPEGGVGVLRRLVEEADALQRVAAAALEVCHFDPRGNDLKPQCAAACYECLMNFGNQQVVMKLDRRKIRDALAQVTEFDGLLGKIQFRTDEPREVNKPWLIVEFKGGKFQPKHIPPEYQQAIVTN